MPVLRSILASPSKSVETVIILERAIKYANEVKKAQQDNLICLASDVFFDALSTVKGLSGATPTEGTCDIRSLLQEWCPSSVVVASSYSYRDGIESLHCHNRAYLPCLLLTTTNDPTVSVLYVMYDAQENHITLDIMPHDNWKGLVR
jgi:hypothetical protein